MKKKSIKFISALAILGLCYVSSDHIDSPSTRGATSDIADLYAFKSPTDRSKTVFVANIQSNVPPGTSGGTFDESVLIQFNIDNNDDLIEDLIIQAIPRNGFMYFFGPYKPKETGILSEISEKNARFIEKVKISSDDKAITTTRNGISYFAGRREDPFFLDVNQYVAVFSGQSTEPGGGFKGPESEAVFRKLNVLSVIVEVPNKYLGKTFDHPVKSIDSKVVNTWLTTNKKQL